MLIRDNVYYFYHAIANKIRPAVYVGIVSLLHFVINGV